MKIFFIACAIILGSCSQTKEIEHYSGWDRVTSDSFYGTGIWRFVDEKYKVIIYVGPEGRISTQKIGESK